MPAEWMLSIVVLNFNNKCDNRNSSGYKRLMISEHGMNVVERALEKRL